ncbi:hypothetical protein FRC12_007819 [Ceratobasidium sp. 428]|nr:hypothetical protein FRC12_007819 [Ceratobasidium sp. 428]
MLDDMCTPLTRTSNPATTAHANRLPPELLSRIFSLMGFFCVLDETSRINGPAGVCRYWRQVAVDAAYLWTHVDIGTKVPRGLTELLLRRSKSAPIHVHAISPELDENQTDSDSFTRDRAEESIVVALEPHIHRSRTLNIHSADYYGYFIQAMLNAWSNPENTPSPLQSLSAILLDPYSTLLAPRQDSARENWERALTALSSLYLYGTAFNWDSNIYRGLIDLQLNFAPAYSAPRISTLQLTSILSICPALVILKLAGMAVDDLDDWIRPAPIVMEHLKVLNFANMSPEHACSMLSLCTVPGPRAELGTILSNSSTLDNRLVDFFARSKITTLYCTIGECEGECDGCIYNDDCDGGVLKALVSFPQHLPHTHTLVLDELILIDALTPELDTKPLPPASQAHMHNVVVLECLVDFDNLRRLVTHLGTQDLHLEKCTTSRLTNHPHQQELERIQTSLVEVYPYLHCSISNTDSTNQLACRTIFDPWT